MSTTLISVSWIGVLARDGGPDLSACRATRRCVRHERGRGQRGALRCVGKVGEGEEEEAEHNEERFVRAARGGANCQWLGI